MKRREGGKKLVAGGRRTCRHFLSPLIVVSVWHGLECGQQIGVRCKLKYGLTAPTLATAAQKVPPKVTLTKFKLPSKVKKESR